MDADAGSDCEEWVLYVHNSISINAKHLNTYAKAAVFTRKWLQQLMATFHATIP
jgi:hypothetical protein